MAESADEPELPLDVEEFLIWLAAERGRSANTLSAYRRDLTTYCRWLSENERTIDSVRPADLDAYVAPYGHED